MSNPPKFDWTSCEYSKQIADERQVGGRITTEADDKVEIDNYKKLFCLYY